MRSTSHLADRNLNHPRGPPGAEAAIRDGIARGAALIAGDFSVLK